MAKPLVFHSTGGHQWLLNHLLIAQALSPTQIQASQELGYQGEPAHRITAEGCAQWDRVTSDFCSFLWITLLLLVLTTNSQRIQQATMHPKEMKVAGDTGAESACGSLVSMAPQADRNQGTGSHA